jgi:cytidylate kinase
MTEYNPRIIVVNGDVCSGSSSIARALSSRLRYELFDVGQEFRKEMRKNCGRNMNELSVALNGLVTQLIATGRHTIIEGRLVGLQARGLSDVFKLLCIAPENIVAQRYMARECISSIEESQRALQERLAHDERLLSKTWAIRRADAFNPNLYDKILDTSMAPPEELVLELVRDGFIE